MRAGSLMKLSVFAMLALFFSAGLVIPIQAAQTLDTIQLDNGILLRDWIDLPAVQSVQSPMETGERAAMYIKRYGPYRELLDIVMKATRSKPFNERAITAENAAQKLAELDTARKKLGEWPQLIISHAKAASLNGKPDAALADLKNWLKVAPVNDKRRKEIVALVVESETDNAAVTRYFTTGGIADGGPVRKRPLPPEVAGLQGIIEQALNCVGRASSSIDAEKVIEGKLSDGRTYSQREVHESYDRGIWSSKDKTTYGNEPPPVEETIIDVTTPPFVPVYHDVRRHTRGTGITQQYRSTLKEISCSTPFFPLKLGKEIEIQTVNNGESTWIGDPSMNKYNSRYTVESKTRIRVNHVYSVTDALKRFPNLRISDSGTENWLVYELSLNNERSYRSVEDSDPSAREIYKPYRGNNTYLYIDGPNLNVTIQELEGMNTSGGNKLQPGWTVTVRELP